MQRFLLVLGVSGMLIAFTWHGAAETKIEKGSDGTITTTETNPNTGVTTTTKEFPTGKMTVTVVDKNAHTTTVTEKDFAGKIGKSASVFDPVSGVTTTIWTDANGDSGKTTSGPLSQSDPSKGTLIMIERNDGTKTQVIRDGNNKNVSRTETSKDKNGIETVVVDKWLPDGTIDHSRTVGGKLVDGNIPIKNPTPLIFNAVKTITLEAGNVMSVTIAQGTTFGGITTKTLSVIDSKAGTVKIVTVDKSGKSETSTGTIADLNQAIKETRIVDPDTGRPLYIEKYDPTTGQVTATYMDDSFGGVAKPKQNQWQAGIVTLPDEVKRTAAAAPSGKGADDLGPVRRKGGEPEDVPTKVEPPKLPAREAFGPPALGPTIPLGGDPNKPTNPYDDGAPTKVEQPKLPAREAFGPPALGPTTPLGGDPNKPTNPYADDGAPTKVEQPKLPAREAFGPTPETKTAIGPTTPLGGSDAGWIRIQGSDGKWFWILPTGKSMLPADPDKNALGPTTPLGGSDAGWKRFQGADGKAYWVLTGTTTMLPADPPTETKTATGPTTPLGGSDAGWIRIQGSDGKWFWILPTGKSTLPADPIKNALGPTTPLGGPDAGWKRFQGTDGKSYWVLTGTTTMLPADPPPQTKTTTGPSKSLGGPTKEKHVQKKPKGKQARRQDPNVAAGPTSSDVATAVGTGIAIGVAVGGMRSGHDRGMSSGASAAPMQPRKMGGSGTGTSGATMNTTVGKPVIKMQGMGVGF